MAISRQGGRRSRRRPENLAFRAESDFLLKAGDILSSSLKYRETLESVAKLVVPELADWFSIYLLSDTGELEIPITAHIDPRKVKWARELQKKYPVDMNSDEGVPGVIKTGKPQMMEEIPIETIRKQINDPERLKLLDILDLKSYITVPLIAHQKIFGALSLVMAGSDRRYQQKDLVFAQRLAQKIAVAVDNARLYNSLEREVWERRLAEKELQRVQSELEERVEERTKDLQKWQHIFENARWGIIVGSPNGQKLEMLNPALAEMFGYTPDELIGRPVELLLAPSARKAHVKSVLTIRAQGHHIWETIGRRKYGTEFPVQVDLTVVKSEGKPLYYVGSVRDLTQRKIVEEELRRSHEELEERVEERTAELEEAVIKVNEERAKDEALLSSIGDAVIAVDKEGRIMFANRITEMMYGIAQKDMLGRPVSEILRVADVSGHILTLEQKPLGAALRSAKRIMGSFYYALRLDGSRVPVSISAAPIMLEGEVVGAIGVYRDITKEREVDQAKSEFVALASHQLRTPLTIISWYTEKLISQNKETQTVKGEKYLEQLYHANKRMLDLVDALLDVSRIESGTLIIDPVKTDFKEVADSVLGELELQIKDKQLRIVRQYDQKLPAIKADPKLLRIIFQNLFSNAVKYSNQGEEVTIKLERRENEVMIVVVDTGYGIPAHQQGQLFTKLFRADNAREKVSDGTGLGLYIVKSIMDQTGGDIWFESLEGKGTTFYAALPITGMARKVAKRSGIFSLR